jgi:hypothetical protein
VAAERVGGTRGGGCDRREDEIVVLPQAERLTSFLYGLKPNTSERASASSTNVYGSATPVRYQVTTPPSPTMPSSTPRWWWRSRTYGREVRCKSGPKHLWSAWNGRQERESVRRGSLSPD